jgi:hypothetical protein
MIVSGLSMSAWLILSYRKAGMTAQLQSVTMAAAEMTSLSLWMVPVLSHDPRLESQPAAIGLQLTRAATNPAKAVLTLMTIIAHRGYV